MSQAVSLDEPFFLNMQTFEMQCVQGTVRLTVLIKYNVSTVQTLLLSYYLPGLYNLQRK